MSPFKKSHSPLPTSPKILEGLVDIVQNYDAFIIDLWGVLHDGRKLFQKSIGTLTKLKDLQKTTLILSNSPRRTLMSIDNLKAMGLTPNLYTHIYTSGEDTHLALKNLTNPWHQKLGRRFYHIGTGLHQAIYEELPFQKVLNILDADFILTTGAEFPKLIDYEEILQAGITKDLPMLCANPDRVVIHDGLMILCCGSIAKKYEELGGYVHYHGKPNASIYEPVLTQLAQIPQNRILAIGDSLTTDILGANQAGMDSLLIMSGIHHQHLLNNGQLTSDTEVRLTSLIEREGILPTYALQDFCF